MSTKKLTSISMKKESKEDSKRLTKPGIRQLSDQLWVKSDDTTVIRSFLAMIAEERKHAPPFPTEGSWSAPPGPGVPTGKVILSARLRSVARSLFNPDRIYRFRLAFAPVLTSDGAGKIDTSVNFQISTAEWSDLAALFDEVRLQSARIRVIPLRPGVPATPATPANIATLVVGSLPATLSAFTSANGLVNCADTMVVPSFGDKEYCLTYHAPKSRPWCLTSDPAGVTTPTSIPSGTMGCFGCNAIGEPLTFSTTYYHLVMENVIQLKLRA
jgi:hypothetical protein